MTTCARADAGAWFNYTFLTQKERDIETGLDFFEARYFSSTQGRFASTDPVYFQTMMAIDPQRFNLYAYARNNPLKFIDPNGENLYLGGDTGWLTNNVLYEMVGGQENFDRYFEIKDGQVVARSGVDATGGNVGVQELLGLVNASQNYLYFAGTDGAAAADLFKGSRDDKGNLSGSGKHDANEFEGNNDSRTGGSLVGTTGRQGVSQPANLANGDPVFAVIAYNTGAVFTQTKVDYGGTDLKEIARSGCPAVECGAQRAGVGKVLRPVSYFIHESTENREFSKMGSDNSNYQFAHKNAVHREATIREAVHISGGFSGGVVERRVPRR